MSDTRTTGGTPLSDEPYSDREDEVTELVGVKVFADPVSEKEFADLDPKFVYPYETTSSLVSASLTSSGKLGPGSSVFVVTVRYDSGDTFGNSRNLVAIYDVFEDAAKALEMAALIDSLAHQELHHHGKVVTDFSFEFDGRTYSKVWAGYFERFNSVSVDTVTVMTRFVRKDRSFGI